MNEKIKPLKPGVRTNFTYIQSYELIFSNLQKKSPLNSKKHPFNDILGDNSYVF
jgi:hypothetical protein